MRKLIRNFFLFTLKIVTFLRFEYLTSLIIFLSLRRIKYIHYGKTNKTFLVLSKSVGIDDLETAFYRKKSKINFYYIDRNVTKIIFRSFVKKKIYKDYDYNTKNIDTNLQIKKFQNYIYKNFNNLKKLKNFEGIINFNVFYYGDVELQKVSKNLGIKFFTIHKEALKPPLYNKHFKLIYQNTCNKFYGNKILTYNNFEKKLMVDSNIAPENKIKVIGMPRLIKSFNISKLKNKNLNKKIILYSSLFRKLPYFNNPDYIKPKHKIFNHKSDLNFFEIQKKTLKLLSTFLNKNENARLTLKVRIGHEKLFRSELLHPKIDIVEGGSGHYLLENHDIVFAFNSTIILEALAANKIVFCPFQNLRSKELFNFLNLTICSNSEKFLIKKLQDCYDDKIIVNKKNKRNILKVLNLYLQNNDKKAGDRLIKALNN